MIKSSSGNLLRCNDFLLFIQPVAQWRVPCSSLPPSQLVMAASRSTPTNRTPIVLLLLVVGPRLTKRVVGGGYSCGVCFCCSSGSEGHCIALGEENADRLGSGAGCVLGQTNIWFKFAELVDAEVFSGGTNLKSWFLSDTYAQHLVASSLCAQAATQVVRAYFSMCSIGPSTTHSR